mgnify:CR=1 FL=1
MCFPSRGACANVLTQPKSTPKIHYYNPRLHNLQIQYTTQNLMVWKTENGALALTRHRSALTHSADAPASSRDERLRR